jgi:pantoate--beta-alanine ligase
MRYPEVLNTVASLRAHVRDLRSSGGKIALVPTMGALHAGHISLVNLAKAQGARVIVSIFVNPTQFAPTEDFSKYPRTFEADLEKLSAAGADAVYAPTPEIMYPQGFSTTVTLAGPAAAGLEDKFRPTHFAGVATVVAKLHIQAMPDIAIYGEKDFQQLAVIRQMTRDLDLPMEVLGGPTIREEDGLALSSRNIYLDPAQRKAAPVLNATMRSCAALIRAGQPSEAVMTEGRAKISAGGFALDYLELRDAVTLGTPDIASGKPLRMLVAAKIGATRLIDNIAV